MRHRQVIGGETSRLGDCSLTNASIMPFLRAIESSSKVAYPAPRLAFPARQARRLLAAPLFAAGPASLRIRHAPEPQRPRTIRVGRHHQEFAMLVQSVGLGKIPDRALRLIVAATPQNAGPRVLVNELLGPLPNVSDHVHYAKRTRPLRMRVCQIWTTHAPRLVGHGHGAGVPLVPPRIEPSVVTLRCVLPLPLVRQPFSRPTRVG